MYSDRCIWEVQQTTRLVQVVIQVHRPSVTPASCTETWGFLTKKKKGLGKEKDNRDATIRAAYCTVRVLSFPKNENRGVKISFQEHTKEWRKPNQPVGIYRIN